jgi:hypothetical protein
MDDLTARLEVLFRRYGAALHHRQGDEVQLAEQFHEEMDLLIEQYGQSAIDAALDVVPAEAWPSVLLH